MFNAKLVLTVVVLFVVCAGASFVGGCVHGRVSVFHGKVFERARENAFAAGKVAGRAEGWKDGYTRGQKDKCGTAPDHVPDDRKPWLPFRQERDHQSIMVDPGNGDLQPIPANEPTPAEPIRVQDYEGVPGWTQIPREASHCVLRARSEEV